MSRITDVHSIAGQIVDVNPGAGLANSESIVRRFQQLTFGLAEYERDQVAWLVNFRLASPVL